MKISSSQMFRNLSKWSLKALALVVFAGAFSVNAQEADEASAESSINGEALFGSKCATCHHPLKDGTGPKLKGVKAAWAENSKIEGGIYNWINNWQNAAATDAYAAEVAAKKPTAMDKFPALTVPEMDAILAYVDAFEDDGDGPAGEEVCQVPVEEEGTSWVWYILGIVFVVIILAIGGVKRQLRVAAGEASEKEDREHSYADSFRGWAWRYKRYVMIGSVVIFISLIVTLFLRMYRIAVVEDYQPSQPIEFPHNVHAGINGIDCKYCHNSVTESRTAGLPTVNVCMNCHKQVTGESDEQKAKIAKIYAAAGWDAEKGVYTGKTKPIVWNKVHVLPDHVYFNHSQHVEVGGVDCIQCHGDMTTMCETAKVQPVSVLNAIEGNVKLTKPTLTMGWCIECHGEKEISTGAVNTNGSAYYEEIHKRLMLDKDLYNKYLEDGKVTVKELGGWECAKCHY
ncbi:MAG: c-type cytochrome [Crocinitomicaceae bacterium]|nr:c-type cytochrome [Crocinitomicaceae bacterium]